MTTWNDVMNAVLPPMNGKVAHPTSWFGVRRTVGSSPHRGIDFNYFQGQSGLNLTHPNVYSPVTGKVISVGGDAYNTISIRDTNGYVHNVLHTQNQFVEPGQRIRAGDVVGTMGGVGAGDVQHVHYGMRDPNGSLINPADYWSGNLGTVPPLLLGQSVPYLERTQAVERMLGDNMGWLGTGWTAFNSLGSEGSWPSSRSAGNGSDASTNLARFESPRSGAAGPVPYLGLTNAARRLYAYMPPSDFPAFPSWASPGGGVPSPTDQQSPNVPPSPEKRSAAPGGPARESFATAPLGGFEPRSNAANGLPPSTAEENFRYLVRSIVDRPQTSVFDTGASPAPFVQPDTLNFRDGLPGERASELARGALRSRTQPMPAPQSAGPLGLVSGQPMPDYLFGLPIWERSESSERADADNEDWLTRLIRTVGAG